MITLGGRYRIPVAQYQAVPSGWTAPEIQGMQDMLRGGFALNVAGADDPYGPAWMKDRKGWPMYRATLDRVVAGLKAGDAGCREIALRYIELRYIGSCSGYLRGRMAKVLRRDAAALDARQRRRLEDHFLLLLERGEHTHEFQQYLRLWRAIASDKTVGRLRRVAMTDERRAWLMQRLAKVA
ncbi:MAG TPA: hypothetical protein VF050_07615 [Moraxellaceae bacterium]